MLSVDDGRLYVGQVKRNKSTMKKAKPPRLALALEIPGREDGAKALQLFASGLVKLPAPLQNRIDAVKAGKATFKAVGDEFRQLLERYKPWASMVAANPDLTPYSLRMVLLGERIKVTTGAIER